jgi:hypothetical protein
MNSNVKARVENCGRCDYCRNERGYKEGENKKTEEEKINDTTKKTVKGDKVPDICRFKGDKKPSTTDLTGCVYIPTMEDVKE